MPRLAYKEEQKWIDREIAKFPKYFRLRAFPESICTVNRMDSFVQDDQKDVQLYVHIVKEDGTTSALARDNPQELRREMIELTAHEKIEVAQRVG
jgi:hypothetical protein